MSSIIVIKLESSDGQIFETDLRTAKQLGVLRKLIEQGDIGDDKNKNAIIPLPHIHSAVLTTILKWAKHHSVDADTVQPEAAASDESNRLEAMAVAYGKRMRLADARPDPMTVDEAPDAPGELPQHAADMDAWDDALLAENKGSMPDLMIAAKRLGADGLLRAEGLKLKTAIELDNAELDELSTGDLLNVAHRRLGEAFKLISAIELPIPDLDDIDVQLEDAQRRLEEMMRTEEAIELQNAEPESQHDDELYLERVVRVLEQAASSLRAFTAEQMKK